MSTFSTVTLVLASAVATSGTFTVGYPAGKAKGNFLNGSDHRMVAIQKEMFVGKDFTISFGDTAATITYLGSTTIPASSAVWVQLDEVGGEYRVEKVIDSAVALKPLWVDLGSPDTADADGIAASQSVSAAANFALDGAYLNSDGVMELDVPRNVVAAWTTTSVLTITGLDVYGNTMVETSASGTSHTGKKAFKQITSVSSSASITSATVGTGDVLGLPFFLRDADMVIAEFENSSKLSGGETRVVVPFTIDATKLAAGTSLWVMAPIAGQITDFRTVVTEAVGTGGAVTLELGGTAVTGASITVADSASAGDLDTTTAITAANTVTAGQAIEIVPASAFATSGALEGFIEITGPANQLGTYVVGSQAQGSGTSGDVRGTLDPTTACDGITSFALVVLVDNPNYLGAPQYAA